jgi:hypothetical protein
MGCAHCQGAAEQARQALVLSRSLLEEPHEGFALFECRYCRQPYLEQFQEILDWANGADDIWVRWMALTGDELARLPTLLAENRFADLNELMHTRRRLTKDPLGRIYWSETAWDAGDRLPPG